MSTKRDDSRIVGDQLTSYRQLSNASPSVSVSKATSHQLSPPLHMTTAAAAVAAASLSVSVATSPTALDFDRK